MNIRINGINVHYETHGAGHPVVLLHGWGTSLRSFDSVLSFLKDRFKVYTIDFPGFGLSEEPDTIWSVYDYADMTQAFLEKMHIENPILMGHSFGGRISIILGSRMRTHKIVLIDAAGVKPTRGSDYYVRVYFYKFMRFIQRIPGVNLLFGDIIEAYKKHAGSSDYKSASETMRRVLSKVVNDDLQHLMPAITAPTLLIWGENDTATPVADAKIMEEKIPGAALIVFERAGHYSYLEQPGKFKAIVNSFIEEDAQ
jgi:pimeloyl-ACP methyl ester carboxylesterase